MNQVAAGPKRSGGLVAVAVLNLVFAVLGLFVGAGLRSMNDDPAVLDQQAEEMDRIADQMAAQQARDGATNPELNRAMMKDITKSMRESSPEGFRVMWAAGVTGGVLLLVSGIGLLGQRRVLGRHGASAAAVALIGCGVAAVAKLSVMFWGFPLLGAVYGVVLLCLVNFVFRRALYR